MQDNKEITDISKDELRASSKNALVTHFRELDKKAETWFQSWNPYHPDVIKRRGFEPVAIYESKTKKQAAKFFLIAFGFFLLWAFFAPINSGVTAVGTVMVSGYRKTLQHPTGGLVQEILVKEGDLVNEGDVLIRINPLKAEAELTAAQLQYINVMVTEARLQAERKGSSKITWPPEINAWASDTKVQEAKYIQEKLFETRRTEFNLAMSSKRIQVSTLKEEAVSNAQLAKEGFVSKSQANQALRASLEAESALNITQSGYYKDIDTQLAQIQGTRDAMKDRFQAVAFDRDLTSIRAPVAGTVVGLKVNTVGGTVPGGQVLAEIVPTESKLIVEAKVPPNVIDRVKVGLPAIMRFTAFNVDKTPVIDGIVKLVGADLQPGAQAGQSGETYLAQVEATEKGLEDLDGQKIQPGMPVDVIFVTGERTFMSYLFKPISDKFAKAFK